jgi:hypothetical protein
VTFLSSAYFETATLVKFSTNVISLLIFNSTGSGRLFWGKPARMERVVGSVFPRKFEKVPLLKNCIKCV